MTANVIKELFGHSGCHVYLMQDNEKMFIRKVGNIQRNLDKLQELQYNVRVPKIYSSGKDLIDMEYIHGIDIKNYLIDNDADELLEFIISIGKRFCCKIKSKDYQESVHNFLITIEFEALPFTQLELENKVNYNLWSSNYHGDLTFENIIRSNHEFVLIDCASGIWDSWLFDLVKLRQDLDCFWFMRENHVMIENKLSYIKHHLIQHWPEMDDNNLLILMLLRVYKHCTNSKDTGFILENIHRLWK
jgi:tRNA A-37 threonylcarbamoyl transferase component Bud32